MILEPLLSKKPCANPLLIHDMPTLPTRRNIFLGYPHRCHDIQDMEEMIARRVFSGSKLPQGDVLVHVKNLAKAAIDCNEAFVRSKVILGKRIISVKSASTDVSGQRAKGQQFYFRTGFTYVHSADLSHAFLPCLPQLEVWIEDFRSRLELINKPASWSVLISQASPVLPIALSRYEIHPLMSSQQYTRWSTNRKSDVLVVHGQYPTRHLAGFAFEKILEKLPLKGIGTYFRFDRNDARYNNSRAFLTTVLVQWVMEDELVKTKFDLETEMSRLQSQGTFTEEDLLILLFRIRSIYAADETVFVLDNLDDCADKLSSFWHLVAKVSISVDRPWKFLIFTRSPDSLDEWVKTWPRIALEDEVLLDYVDPHVRHDIDNTMSQLENDHFSESMNRRRKENLLRCCGHDIGLTRLLLLDLRTHQFRQITQAAQEMTTRMLLRELLDNIPQAKRSLVVNAITWVMFAFRPLSIGELQSALTESEQSRDFDCREVMNALAECSIFDFSTMQEVKFQHAELRDMILEAQDEWFGVKETEHEMILKTCLKLLRTVSAHECLSSVCIAELGLPSTPFLKNQTNLSIYAACYWTQHYQLAPNKISLEPCILGFLHCKESFRNWQMARWVMSNPISRTDRTYLSKIPLLASIGSPEIYKCWKEDQGISGAEQQKWLFYAVVEAARNGQREMCRDLLQTTVLDSMEAGHALTAACSGGDESLLINLMTHIRTMIPAFVWPMFLIRRASEVGYVRIVRVLIDDGADFSSSDALLLAARNGQVEVIKLIMKHDLRLDLVMQKEKDLALRSATLHGDAELVRALIEYGASVDDVCVMNAYACASPASVRILLENLDQTKTTDDEDGLSKLHKAVAAGAHDYVELLLKLNIDPNGIFSDTTALIVAVKEDDIEMAKLLVKHDADVNLQSTSSSPLFSACVNGKVDMANWLIDMNVNVDQIVNDIWSPLHGAYENAAVTRLLLKAGASVDPVIEGSWCSPLFLAVGQGPAEVVEVLLEHKANVNLRYRPEDLGMTPLASALQRKRSDIARLLLEAGADTSLTGTNGICPIYYAQTADLLRLVLQFGPDLALKDRDGDTPLNALMTRENATLEEVKLLVYAGSDLNTANNEGQTALHRSMTRNNLEIAEFLLKRGASVLVSGMWCGTPLHSACSGSAGGVRLALDAGADVNHVHDYLGVSAQSACMRLSPLVDHSDMDVNTTLDILRCLSESGSGSRDDRGSITEKMDIDMAGGYYGCALSAACYCAPIAVVRFVLSLGASTHTRDQVGRFPIHWAAAAQSLASFEILVDEGTDLYARDKVGRTIVHFAAISGRLELLRAALHATEGLLNATDDDGWTALHYAARGMYPKFANIRDMEDEQVRKHEAVTFLIEQGADVRVVSSEPNGKHWSPLKLAHYHGASQDTLDLLMPKIKTSLAGEIRDDEFHKSKKAFYQQEFCTACNARACGVCYRCENCLHFYLCYKCYASKDVLHPGSAHTWEPLGMEFDDSYVLEYEAMKGRVESDNDNEYDSDSVISSSEVDSNPS